MTDGTMIDRIIEALELYLPSGTDRGQVARDVLEAMREPTKEMLDVVDRYEGDDAHVYSRMIDAALKEKP